MSFNWVAVIPARAGSKGLKNKNTQLLNGKPLYMHAVDLAIEAGASRVIVTTNIEEIIQTAKNNKLFDVVVRDESLCNDSTSMKEVMIDTLRHTNKNDVIVLLQPTSPLRQLNTLTEALNEYSKTNISMVLSVTEADNSCLKYGFNNNGEFIPFIPNKNYSFMNRQILPKIVKPNGAIYVFKSSDFQIKNNWPTEKIGCIVMPPSESIDIDTGKDLIKCEETLRDLI